MSISERSKRSLSSIYDDARPSGHRLLARLFELCCNFAQALRAQTITEWANHIGQRLWQLERLERTPARTGFAFVLAAKSSTTSLARHLTCGQRWIPAVQVITHGETLGLNSE